MRTIERMESSGGEGRGVEPAAAADPPGEGLFRWAGVLQGALVGLAGVAVVAILVSALDRTSLADETRDRIRPLLLFGLFAAYGLAGWFAGRRAPRAPFANGTAAAFGALIAWVPLRIAIWAARSDDNGLFSGDDAVFTTGAIYSQVLIATAFGMLGGWLGARRTRFEEAAEAVAPSPRPDDSAQAPATTDSAPD